MMFIAIDAGTTRTRAWLVSGDEVRDEQRAQIGVGDSARDGSNRQLVEGLAALIARLDESAGGARPPVFAAGMIGSSLGLGHVPHAIAPAGLDDLAAALQPFPLPGTDERPVWIVPGIRTPTADDDDPGSGDVMRGEETLGLGLLAMGAVLPGEALFTVGSHWKRIAIDPAGRIAGSRTSLGGEMIEVVRTGTLLADAVPAEWPPTLPAAGILAGVALAGRVGLPRAMFEVRLQQLARHASPEYRLAVLTGAVIGADLAGWPPPTPGGSLVLTGASPIADAWGDALSARGWPVRRVALADAERATRLGLGMLARRRGLVS